MGSGSSNGLMADDDLKILRANPKFQQIVAELNRPQAK
jgi:hypothetical protein